MKPKILIILIILTILIIYWSTIDYDNLFETFTDVLLDEIPNNIISEKFYSNDLNDYQGCPKLSLNLYEQDEPYNLSLENFNAKFNTNIKGLSNRVAAVGIDTTTEPKFFIYVDYPTNSNYLGITIDYIMKHVHNSLNKTKYYFILCYNDGYKFNRDNLIENNNPYGMFLSYPTVENPLKYVFSYAKRIDDTNSICIPDPYYCYRNQHRKQLKEIKDNYVRWLDKKEECIWRGDPNNSFNINFVNSEINGQLNPRQYLIKLYNNKKIKKFNYERQFTTISEQIKYKYILDIDGWSNTWDATVWKLYSGSVLLKVKSLWKQWYYDELKEWEHYVPINNDLSDINEKIEWCINNDDKCKQIVKNGNDFVVNKLNNAYVKNKTIEIFKEYFNKLDEDNNKIN
jgi:hypothetical protein